MELFKIFGSILVDDKDAIKSLGQTRAEAKKTQDAANKLGDAGRKIGTAFIAGSALVGTAALAITGKTVKVLDDIDKASQRAGMGAEEFQRWGHVASLSGIEMGTLEKAAIRNQRAMAQASQGAGRAADAYKALGINIEGMNSDETFEAVILNLSEMENETERNAIANDLFGRSFADLAPLLNSGKDDIVSMKGELDGLGAIMSEDSVKAGAELNDAMDRMGKMFGALALKIGVILIPHFQKISDWILDNKENIVQAFETALGKIADLISWVKDNANWLIPVLAGMLGGFIAFQFLSTIIPLFQAFITVVGALKAGTLTLNAAMLANPAVWMAAIFAALVAAGVLLYRNWDTVKEKLQQLGAFFSSVFGNIKTTVSNVFNSVISTVKSGVDKVKSFLNFKWAFPKLKMPKFSISGSANPLNWLKQGVPKLKVDWYAKGGIMTKPTAFDYDGDTIKAGGERGHEAILPLNEKNLSAIGRGISQTMNSGGYTLDDLIFALKLVLTGLKLELVDGAEAVRTVVDERLLEVV